MNLLFRTDASLKIGTGHVMRCLALAQAWQDAGGRAVFAMAETTPAIREKLQAEACEVVSISAQAGTEQDSRETLHIARSQGAEWVVVDGYRFDSDFQCAVKAAGLKLLFLDDNGHVGFYTCDLVLNQNVHATQSMYAQREPYTRLLLGTSYSLLRREFRSWSGCQREIPETGRKLLVTFGGSDPDNLTGLAMQAIGQVNVLGLEVVVVVGPSNPHYAFLGKIRSPQHSVRLEQNVADMARLMASADLAVSAAGTTCLEMCFLGLPAIAVAAAENQRASARELDRQGCVVHLEETGNIQVEQLAEMIDKLLKSPAARASLSQRGRELVDGNGAKRVIAAIQRASSADEKGYRER